MITSLLLASTTALAAPPARVGVWSRPESPRVVLPEGIFAYMDGAGELYLAYGLVRLEVYEYTAAGDGAGEDPILLEIYHLASSDDGYGLLSGDWSGEPLALDAGWPATPPRALYGAGLLRVWSGDLYLRVMASSETPASRAAVVELGRALVSGRPGPPPPEIVQRLPGSLAGRFRLRGDSVTFLRSHLVLNSVYFLGTENLLDLTPETEAVAARYDPAGSGAPLRLLIVRYPDQEAARRAFARFRRGYLERGEDGQDVARVEDGWTGVRRRGRELFVVFQAEEKGTVEAVLDERDR